MADAFNTGFIVGLAFGLFASWIADAQGHAWYDEDCCNIDDCRPAKPGEIKFTAQGYVAHGQLLKHDDPGVRQGKDRQYHICLVPVHPDLAMTTKENQVTCIYRPIKIEGM